nr:MAG TPA: hypothetical protein [Caudoviricetes sp.]
MRRKEGRLHTFLRVNAPNLHTFLKTMQVRTCILLV